MNKLKWFWGNLQASFWFLPSLIVVGSIAIAIALIEADSTGSREWLDRWPHLFGASAAGARGMLSTIAGSMMTVVGVTFSMTLVTLALASSQYTSRILRNFMRDRVTQVVLGIFAGIFTYCLIVLRTIRGGENTFVPSLAVFFGVVLAIGGISVLIYFIHHIASSIQASNIIASVAAETMQAIDRMFPKKTGHGPADDERDSASPPLPACIWQTVAAPGNGYIQSVDNATLLRLAREHRTIIRMESGVGEFVVHNAPLASLAMDTQPDKAVIADLQGAYSIDRYRTVEQDIGFGVGQIVDIALRALSPGINDTTTAEMCVDYLTAILAQLASRSIASSQQFEDGQLRIITVGPTFASLVAASFDQIRESAKGNVAIMIRMLGALETIGDLTASSGRRRMLGAQVQWIAELAERTIESPQDLARIASRLVRVLAASELPRCE